MITDEQLQNVETTYAVQRELLDSKSLPLTTAHLSDIRALCAEIRRLRAISPLLTMLASSPTPPRNCERRPDGFPRRGDMTRWHPAEKAIFDATQEVEKAGAHVFLTDAVILLGAARECVADYVELPFQGQ